MNFYRVQRLMLSVCWTCVVGMVIFCFSIYSAVLWAWPAITLLTPIGGTLLMVAWLLLIGVSIKL